MINNKMLIGYSLPDWRDIGEKVRLELSPISHPHILLTGASGSGKSNACLWLLSNFIKTMPNSVYMLDFKGNREWKFLSDYPLFFAGNQCLDGLRKYYNAFKQAQANDKEPTIQHLLIFDEYPAFIQNLTMQDKLNKTKYLVEAQSMLMEILAMGRSLGYGVWILAQRPDANLFVNGSRDNFMVMIGLGNMSREHKQMLFSGYDLPNEQIYKAGEGLLFADGFGVMEVKYPLLKDLSEWKYHIFRLLMQDFLEDAESISE